MTLDQACVLSKEILIGEKVPCIVYAAPLKYSVVVVPTTLISEEVQQRVVALGRGRGATVHVLQTEIRIV